MNFLAPLFLAGAAAIAVPIVFHLIRRSTKRRTIFSSLMFLRPSPPQLSRRSRLQDILLLLLRCLALLLLALGFARPFLRQIFPDSPGAAAAKRTIILLDVSASMNRQEVWAQARARAESIVRKSSPADQLAVYTFGEALSPLITFAQWNAAAPGERTSLALSRLEEAKPGWSSTKLDVCLIRTSEILAETDVRDHAGHGQIVLITDLQEGSQTRGLQGHEWPKGVEVIAERVGPKDDNNAGIQLVAENAQAAYSADRIVRVRVTNAARSKREKFQIGWAQTDGKYFPPILDLYVPPGQSRVISIPFPAGHPPVDRIQLSGDDDPFDNTVFVVPPDRVRTIVRYFGADTAEDRQQPLFFLNRALQETRGQEIQIVATSGMMELPPAEFHEAALFVVTGTLPEPQIAKLRDAVAEGKTLLLAPENVAAAAVFGALLKKSVIMVAEASVKDFALLADINFAHPLFTPFADPRFSDFTKIHFWKYRRYDLSALPEARVLAAFDSGDPAIIQMSIGKGRVLVFAGGWHPADSQLALSSKFVPLLYSLLEMTGASTQAPAQYFVGASLPLNLPAPGSVAPTVEMPDGTRMSISNSATNFDGTALPGLYSFATGTSTRRFAVNLDPAESRTAVLPTNELDRLGVPGLRTIAAVALPERKTHLKNAELEAHQKLWRWFLFGTMAVLGLETWLAGRSARRTMITEAATV